MAAKGHGKIFKVSEWPLVTESVENQTPHKIGSSYKTSGSVYPPTALIQWLIEGKFLVES